MLILLDEPFAAVDPKTTEDIRRNIRELAHQGIAILLTDHNVREVLKITDRSYLIKDGKVVTQGTPQQLIHDPIAISEYLGTTFSDNTFGSGTGSPPAASANGQAPPPSPTLVFSVVEALRVESSRSAAVQELLRLGRDSVQPLTQALGRGEADLRVHAFEVLQRIVPTPLAFDPYASEDVRTRQLFVIRQSLAPSK